MSQSAKRKREEMFVNTTVYVVGVTQYKATLHLPRWTIYTRNEVAKAAEEQDVRTVPSLPQGTFDVLHSSATTKWQYSDIHLRQDAAKQIAPSTANCLSPKSATKL